MSNYSKPKSTKKFALLVLVAVGIISSAIYSVSAFDDKSTVIQVSDIATFTEEVKVVAHYSIQANDDAVFGEAKPSPTLQTQGIRELHTVDYDPNGVYPNNIPIQYHADVFEFGGVGLLEWYKCPEGSTVYSENNKMCIDSEGNLLDRELIPEATERIHNRVVDQGEQFLLAQMFQSGAVKETVDTDLFGAICVTIEVAFVDTSEAETANGFDTGNTTTETNCIEDTTVVIASGIATIGALTFDAPTHVGASDTITGFGICQATSTPYADCEEGQPASAGEIFSVINSADRTLETSETVDITYTFDISSSGA